MAKRKTHWAVRRKNKQARTGEEGNDNDDGERKERGRKNEGVDRRAGFSEAIHPGSYAAVRKAELATKGEAAAVEDAAVSAEDKVTKRRYGIWLAFCGKNYSGMQMNEGVKTIEAEVERALFEAGAIAEVNYGFLQKVGWSRAARTDKGVHAAGQLLTAKLQVGDDIPTFMVKVNAALPEDIRVMHMVTVTKNFNAKLACDQRTYEYLAPTFIFGKRSRSAANPPPSGGKWPANLHDTEEEINTEIEITPETLKQHQEFRMDDETHALLNKVLREYEGTHNFHNFTSKLEPTSPKCNRYITSFAAEKPFVENNMEWIRLRVIGQSFLLHHIRKMIGAAVEVVAGLTDIGIIDRATHLDKMDLPKAPSVGLYLAQAHFKIYNLKMQDSIQTSHPPLDLEDEQVAAAVEQFKRDYIFDHIIKHEEATRTYAKWMRTLETLPFDYVAKSYAAWKKEKEELAALTDRAAKREAVKAAAQRATQARAEAAATAEMSKADKDQAMTMPPELSDTALKLSQVIEREVKRSSALRSSHLSRVRSSFSSFHRSSLKRSSSKKSTSSVAPVPVPEHAEGATLAKDDEPRVEERFPRGSKVAQLHRQGSKMRSAADASDADEVAATTRRQRLWLLLDDPQSSQTAHYLSVFIFGFVTVSTVVFIAQTEDGLAMYASELDLIEMICAGIFSIELLLRMLACPSRTAFFKNYANWIDISAIFPFYLERILQVDNAGTFGAIRIVRLTRVARVLKMSRYSSAIQVFVQAIAISMKALSMLIFLMAIAMIVFSSMIYFAEYTRDGCRTGGWVGDCSSSDTVPPVFASSIAGAAAARAVSPTSCICVDPNPYKSIASSFWWCIVTMSTVGYGDMTPVTLLGKVVGCASVLTGMLVLALPITVIGTNFQKVMKSVMQQTMKSNVDYLKGKRMLCRNEIEAILERFHAVTEDIHLDVDAVINVYDEDNNGMLEDEELAKFRVDLEILQNRFMMNNHHGGGGGGNDGAGSGPEVALRGTRPTHGDTPGGLASTWTLGSSIQSRQQSPLRMYHHSPALHSPRRSSTSSAMPRPVVGPFLKAASQEDVVRRSTAFSSSSWTSSILSESSSSVAGPGTVLLQRDIRSDTVMTRHAGSTHSEPVEGSSLPGGLDTTDPHHDRHRSDHVAPHETTPLTPSSASQYHAPPVDSEVFWLRMMDVQHAWEERLLETEQRLEAKLQILTKILIRVEGMLEADD